MYPRHFVATNCNNLHFSPYIIWRICTKFTVLCYYNSLDYAEVNAHQHMKFKCTSSWPSCILSKTVFLLIILQILFSQHQIWHASWSDQPGQILSKECWYSKWFAHNVPTYLTATALNTLSQQWPCTLMQILVGIILRPVWTKFIKGIFIFKTVFP